MVTTATAGPAPMRVVRRQSIRPTVNVRLRLTRPSFTDLRLAGDPWIEHRGEERLVMYFNNWPLAVVRGIALDAPALNQLLDRIRHRPPRRRR
jgi:hypothetical protein